MKTFVFAVASVLSISSLTASASAQPILNRVEQLVRDQLGAAGKAPQPPQPGYLGLIGDDADDAGRGVRVLDVVAGQAAAQAGLRIGDLITRIGDQPIRMMDDMAAALAGKPEGTRLTITAVREGAERQFNVTLGRRSQSEPAAAIPPAGGIVPGARPRLGVRSVPVTEDIRRQNNLPAAQGALVVSVVSGSPAERAGIPLGSVVTAVNQTPVATPEQLAQAIASNLADTIDLTYVHRGQPARKRVTLAATSAAGASPNVEVRARQPLPERPGPAPDDASPADKPIAAPPVAEPPPPAARITALEKRIEQLEAQIKTLEAELARQKTPPSEQK